MQYFRYHIERIFAPFEWLFIQRNLKSTYKYKQLLKSKRYIYAP